MGFTTTVYHVKIFTGRIVSDGIGVDGQSYTPDQLIRVVLENLDFGGGAIYNKELVQFGEHQDVVRFLEISKGTNVLVRLEVENFNRRIFLRSNEEPLAFQVHAEMVPVARYTGHGDRLQEPERRLVLRRRLERESQSQIKNECDFLHFFSSISEM